MNKDFGANKRSAKIITEGEFGGNYFRDLCSGINDKW